MERGTETTLDPKSKCAFAGAAQKQQRARIYTQWLLTDDAPSGLRVAVPDPDRGGSQHLLAAPGRLRAARPRRCGRGGAAEAEEAEAQPEASGGSASSGAAAASSAAAAAPGEGAESGNLLIEALLKIDDGSVQTLHVRAADRSKDVARRFVQEHSLKAWFEEPLTAWLKKAEAEADRFPVTIEGDLMEIRKTHSKAK